MTFHTKKRPQLSPYNQEWWKIGSRRLLSQFDAPHVLNFDNIYFLGICYTNLKFWKQFLCTQLFACKICYTTCCMELSWTDIKYLLCVLNQVDIMKKVYISLLHFILDCVLVFCKPCIWTKDICADNIFPEAICPHPKKNSPGECLSGKYFLGKRQSGKIFCWQMPDVPHCKIGWMIWQTSTFSYYFLPHFR
jgi:hypothetical protein